jgi:hypothetical protein
MTKGNSKKALNDKASLELKATEESCMDFENVDENDGLHDAQESWRRRAPVPSIPRRVQKRAITNQINLDSSPYNGEEMINTYPGKYSSCSNAQLQSFTRDLSLDRYLIEECMSRIEELKIEDIDHSQTVDPKSPKTPKIEFKPCDQNHAKTVLNSDTIVVDDDDTTEKMEIEETIKSAEVVVFNEELKPLDPPFSTKGRTSRSLYIGEGVISAFVNNMMILLAVEFFISTQFYSHTPRITAFHSLACCKIAKQ